MFFEYLKYSFIFCIFITYYTLFHPLLFSVKVLLYCVCFVCNSKRALLETLGKITEDYGILTGNKGG